MTLPLARTIRVTLLCIALSACGSLPSHQLTPEMQQESDWTTMIAQVNQAGLAGRYDLVDRLLADYASRYPASDRGTEALYWRALYKLDPANSAPNPHEAIALLDSYLGAPLRSANRTNAQVLRRIATLLETRPTVVTVPAPATPAQTASSARDDKAKDEELAKVKDDLAKANAELERIKKRLAAPKP